MGSISLLIPGFPSANLAVQEELPSVFILSWTLLSNHAKLLRLIFPTIKEQKNMGLPARTPKQAVQKELEHQRGLCEGNGFVVGPVRVYWVRCAQRTEKERFLGVYERSLPWTKWGYCFLNSSIKVTTSAL